MIDAGWFVDVALKSAAVAALALLAARLLRRRSAAERSAVLHGGLVAMAVLPLLVVFAPRWHVRVPDFAAPAVAETNAAASASLEQLSRSVRVARVERVTRGARVVRDLEPVPARPSFDAATAWGVAYALPALALLFSLAMSLSRLRALRDRAVPVRDARWDAALYAARQRCGVHGYIELLHSPDATSPLSWGMRRRIIVLDALAIDPDAAEALLAHELAHLARQDWIKLLFSRVLTALFWFNPLAWWLARQCHQLREEAADDAVLRGEVAGDDYADMLLRFARNGVPQRAFAAHAMFSGRGAVRHLGQRLQRVLDEGQRRAPAVRAWSLGSVGVALLVALPVAAFAPGAATVQAPAIARTAAALPQAVASAQGAPGELGFVLEPRRNAEAGRIQLTINEETDRGRSTNSGGIEIAKLQGLSTAALASEQPQSVRFAIVRDAGRLDCDGAGQRNRASGTCHFTPDPAFASELERRGVGKVSAREHLMLALQDAKLDVLDELARQGYEMPDAKRFVEFAIHDVDVAWLRGLASAGLKLDSLARLVEFRIHDIDAQYVGDLKAAGYDQLTPRQLLEFRIHDVTADTIVGLAEAGFSGMPARELVNMHIHDVTPAFAREMKALGYGDVGAERLVEFRIHDVTPQFVRDLQSLGYKNLEAARLVEFRIHDVTPAFIREISELGYRNVAPRDLVAMQIHDVSPAYVRSQLAGNGAAPSVDELVERRIQGD